MKNFYFLLIAAFFLICSCNNETNLQKTNKQSDEYLLLTGEWENQSISNDLNDWLGSSLSLEIKENGTIINNKGQRVKADIKNHNLYIEKDSIVTIYKIKYDAGFINIQMIKDKNISNYLFKRVQNTLIGLWICDAETSFHQVEADGWTNNDWIWSFQGPLSFYNDHTCINKKGETAQWEMNDSILTITYKKQNINWILSEHYTLTWEKEREGFINKDLHIYSLVPAPAPTFN